MHGFRKVGHILLALYASISDELKLSEPLESAKTTDPVLDLVETFFFLVIFILMNYHITLVHGHGFLKILFKTQ